MAFERINSKTIYQGRVFNLQQDEIRLPDGKTARLDIVTHPGAVVLLPLDEAGQIIFIRQYRYSAGEELLELPAGTLEAGEAPESCAMREIREETGLSAEKVEKIGEFFLAPGYSTEFLHIFLATGLQPAPLQGDSDEFIQVEPLSIEQAYDLAETGQMRDAKTLAVLALARRYLK